MVHFFTKDEPASTHHNHPKSIIYLRVHVWCFTFCRCGQMYNGIYLSSYYHTEYFKCPKNHLCSAYLSSPHTPPQPLVTTELFIVSIVLPFPEHHRVGIIQYAVFSDWLLLLSNVHLRILHVFSWLDSSSFFFSAVWYSIVWKYHSLFIHSPTEGYLGCFQVWQLWVKLL